MAKEWQGIMEREILKLGLSKSDLINMGILLPATGGKRLVNMQMLFESKMLGGAFNKFKCRLVAQGHPGAVRKHIDYDSVFATAPHLEGYPREGHGCPPPHALFVPFCVSIDITHLLLTNTP